MFDKAANDLLQQLSRRGGARVPATLGEVWDTEWRAGALDTMSGVGAPREAAWSDLVGGLEKVTGKSLRDLEAESNVNLARAGTFDEKVILLGRVLDTLGKEERLMLEPLRDVEANARRKAATLEKDKRDVEAASYGLTAAGVGFMANAARQMVEPVNILSMPLGAARGVGLARFLLTEAAVNAGAQAVQEPFIQSGRASLGLDAGFGQAAANVIGAGVAGAGLAGLMRVGAAGLKRVFAGRAAEAAGPDLRLQPEDFDAAARHIETQDALEARLPPTATAEDALQHGAQIDAHARALEAGRLADVVGPDIAVPPSDPLHGAPARLPGALQGADVPALPVHRVATAAGDSIELKPLVVEASALRSSSDAGYPMDLQPRDRGRQASQAQIAEIAARLDPERLGLSTKADRGAPIVGDDGVVESGNGRVLAIRRAYETGGEQAQAYRDFIARQGVDVSGFREPVLVRQRLTELDPVARRDFAYNANISATLSLSAPERALADANLLTPGVMAEIRNPGDLGAAANVPFVRKFLSALPQSEQGAFAGADGRLSAEGLRRLRAAVVGRAYEDAGLLARVTEATDDEVKSISQALLNAAPEWAQLRADIDAGRVPRALDITPHLMEAVRRTADLKNKRLTLEAFEAQIDAFDPPSAETIAFMRMFWNAKTRRTASIEQMTERLKFYTVEARKVQAEAGLDLGLKEVTAHDIQTLALADAKNAGTGAADAGPVARDAAGGSNAGRSATDGAGRSGGEQGAGSSETAPAPQDLSVLPASGPGIAAAPQGLSDLSASVAVSDAIRALGISHAKVVGAGDFGPVISGLEGRAADAIALLSRAQTGEAAAVLRHPAIDQPIDLVWGRPEYGLQHIGARHPEMLRDLPAVWDQLTEVTLLRDGSRIQLASPTHGAVVRLDWSGQRKAWLLTAYDRSPSGTAASGRLSDAAGQSPHRPDGASVARIDGSSKADLFDTPAIRERLTALDAEMQAAGLSEVRIVGPNGEVTRIAPGDAFRDIKDDAAAMAALRDCAKGAS